jgi:hypothetical protein
LLQRHRPEVPGIDADIHLSRQGRQAAVAVAMQVEPAPAHVTPGAEGIVAKDEADTIQLDLDIGSDAGPPSHTGALMN